MVMATIDLMPLTLDLSEIGLNDDSKVFVFFVFFVLRLIVFALYASNFVMFEADIG